MLSMKNGFINHTLYISCIMADEMGLGKTVSVLIYQKEPPQTKTLNYVVAMSYLIMDFITTIKRTWETNH